MLVNNAGVGQVVPLALMEEEDWDRMMNVNVKGAFLVTQAVLRGMVRRAPGPHHQRQLARGREDDAGAGALRAAKAALRGFTEALAKEIGRYGITVNCIAPGMLDEGVSDNLPPAKREEYLRNCALGRVGTFAEVAEVVAFMASRPQQLHERRHAGARRRGLNRRDHPMPFWSELHFANGAQGAAVLALPLLALALIAELVVSRCCAGTGTTIAGTR